MQTTARTTYFTLLLVLFLAGCTGASLPRAAATASAPVVAAAAQTYPAPQAPFDTTPITPAESAGAAQAE